MMKNNRASTVRMRQPSSSSLACEVKTGRDVHARRHRQGGAAVDPGLEARRIAPWRIPVAAQQEHLRALQAGDQPIALRRLRVALQAIDRGIEVGEREAKVSELLLALLPGGA